MDYTTALDRILNLVDFERMVSSSQNQFPTKPARYDLKRTVAMLDMLGNPQKGRPTVHVTGTKGKGSTAAMCVQVLCQQGYRTGLYTSPHLHTFRERISVDCAPVTETDFAALVDELWLRMEEVTSYGRMTLFEFLTSMALFHFRKVDTRFNVLEVGLGGRLDATNVVTPQVCIITSISLDHTSVLGNTIKLIAKEKAGIIKPDVPVISAPQSEDVAAVIRTVSQNKRSRLVEVGREVTWEASACQASDLSRVAMGQELTVRGRLGRYDLWIPLLGDFQAENAATAIAALEVLVEQGYPLSADSIRRGFANVQWPCRMEVLDPGVSGPLVVADGAHNPHSAAKLRDSIPKYFDYDRVVIIIGVSNDKNLEGIVAEFAAMNPLVIATASRHPKAVPTPILAESFQAHGLQVIETKDTTDALETALEQALNRDIILATGSLFVAAEIREVNMGIKPELYPEPAVG